MHNSGSTIDKKAHKYLKDLGIYGKSQKEAINIIIDSISKRAYYDRDFKKENLTHSYVSSLERFYSDDSGLICGGYQRTFSHFLDILGIENYAVQTLIVDDNNKVSGHVYNKVVLDNGSVYYFDITFYDTSDLDKRFLWFKKLDMNMEHKDEVYSVVLEGSNFEDYLTEFKDLERDLNGKY